MGILYKSYTPVVIDTFNYKNKRKKTFQRINNKGRNHESYYIRHKVVVKVVEQMINNKMD
jgi:hypothetical protein